MLFAFNFTTMTLWSRFLLKSRYYREKNTVTQIFLKENKWMKQQTLWSVTTHSTICVRPTLPQVLKDVSTCTESPPHLSHAGPFQLCASLFCQSADGNNRDNYRPATHSVNMLVWYSKVVGSSDNCQSVAHKHNEALRPHLWGVEGPQEAPRRKPWSNNPTVFFFLFKL